MHRPMRVSIALVLVASLVTLLHAPLLAAEPPAKSVVADPGTAGMDAATLAKIPPRMQQFVDAKQIAGAVTMVIRGGQIVQIEPVGYANLEDGRAMTADSIFAIASMTKPITATAVLMLQDEGKLSVSDPVSKHLPQFKGMKLASGEPARELTIRDLMTHTSGITRPQSEQPRPNWSLAESAEKTAALPLQFEPGSKWQYGDGLSVCGRIIEVVSGQPYDEFLTARIFRPLGMKDSTFHLSDEQRGRRAATYQPGKEAGTLEATTNTFMGAPTERRTPNPSGGLYSTAADLARFYRMITSGGELDGQRIVSKAAIEQMTHIQTGDIVTGFTPGNGWGLGWCVVREPQGVTRMLSPGTFGHGGAFGTQAWIDPQRQLVLVLLIQRTNFGNSDGSDIRDAFQELAVQAIRP